MLLRTVFVLGVKLTPAVDKGTDTTKLTAEEDDDDVCNIASEPPPELQKDVRFHRVIIYCLLIVYLQICEC